MSTVPPIHREVVVDADPATAFDVFTTRLGRWWPVAYLPAQRITIAVTTTLGPKSDPSTSYSTDPAKRIAAYLAPGHPIS
jgi:hypothetical protein